MDQINRWSVDL